MARLADISKPDLLDALDNVEGKKPTLRLMVAILYKSGPSVPMIADWFELRVPTVYRWFDRIEAEPLSQAVRDRQRPGRPPRLDANQRKELSSLLECDPESISSVNTDAWTIDTIQQLIEERFAVKYSKRHIRRLVADTEVEL